MRAIGVLLGIAILTCVSAFAQRDPAPTGFNLVGMWSGMYHEDELERTAPGPRLCAEHQSLRAQTPNSPWKPNRRPKPSQ